MDSGPSVVHVALRLWLPVAGCDKPPVVEQVGEPWPDGPGTESPSRRAADESCGV